MNPALMPSTQVDGAEGDEQTDAIAERRQKYGDIEATYDASDNKLRLRCFSGRLPREVYARVKAAGFSWAPKQELFVAPAWTPEREDLALELAGDIDDEDTTLAERADQRAERFEGYEERRKAESHSAHQAVSAIADNIPLGQPILVGHHSERRARRDAERIRSGMAKAVSLFRTAEYWARRAEGAKAHASYKEDPGVRARRIKGLEADGRKWEKANQRASRLLELWTILHEPDSMKRKDGQPTTFLDRALYLANQGGAGPHGTWSDLKDGKTTPEAVQAACIPVYTQATAHAARWVEHITNRLTYERAMLEEGGGLAGAKFEYQPGGRVLRRGKWYPVIKVNKRDGQTISVTVAGHWGTTVSLDQVVDYRPPGEGDAEKAKAIATKPPLCNYPGEGFRHMTKAEWDARPKWSDARTTQNVKGTDKQGAHRVRCVPTAGFNYQCVFLSDVKRVDAPAPAEGPAPRLAVERDAEDVNVRAARLERTVAARTAREAEAAPFKAMEQTLKAGVKVVSAPQLFPTPAPLAARMVEVAQIEPGMCVLEPSGGTGMLAQAVIDSVDTEVLVYEINPDLCSAMARKFPSYKVQVRCADFLTVTEFQGCYPRIIMNPPFTHGADLEHIRHALKFLAPGGRLVGLCADGEDRREALQAIIAERGGSYQELPEGSFREQGTDVRVALVVIEGESTSYAVGPSFTERREGPDSDLSVL